MKNAISPAVITETTLNDTDDPAIWVNRSAPAQSRIIGTDKNKVGGIYMYDLDGNIVNKITDLNRPNNIDVAYDFEINGIKTDIAVVTERNTHKIRVFSLPELRAIDGGGIPVFEQETDNSFRESMGIALYTYPDGQIDAIVGRKTGLSEEYLWQYRLVATPEGIVKANVIRKFGSYSGKKEIEAIAVDNELGYVYYCDETAGIRKYYADPSNGNKELAFFGQKDAKRDHEGIAIYKKDDKKGYILVSNQQKNTILVYKREGDEHNPHKHSLLAEIPVSTIECDGADSLNFNFNDSFPQGIFVAMSNGKVFHIYDWRKIQEIIDGKNGN